MPSRKPRRHRLTLFVLLLGLAGGSASAQTSSRPLDDWLSVNQTPPDILWFDAGAPDPAPRVYFDLFGRTNSGSFLGLGTSFEGSVRETPLANGRARVQVMVRATRVLTYAITPSGLIFGHRAFEIASGQDAALADFLLTVEFENRAPGEPLPSLHALSFDRQNPSFQLEKMALVAQATGTLRSAFGVPEGTPGVLRTTQRQLANVRGMEIEGHDLFPAEKIEIRAGR